MSRKLVAPIPPFGWVFARLGRSARTYMQTLVFTIFAKNYLAHARALMDSVSRHHTDVGLSAILVDRAGGYFDPLAEDFETVSSEELPIQASREFHFKYSLLELSTAV